MAEVRGGGRRACPPAVVSGGVHDGGHGRFRTRFVLARDPQLVRGGFRRAHRGAGGGLAGHRRGLRRAGRRADRIGQDARGLSRIAGPAGGRPATRRGEEALPCAVRVTDEGARRGRGAESAVTPDRDPSGVGAAGSSRAGGPGGDPLRRHPSGRTPLDGDEAPGHPDHHPGIPVPHAHLLHPGRARRGRDGDRRRGARGRRHQARRAPRGVPGAAGRAAAAPRSAYRAVGDGPPGRRGRAVPVAPAEGGDRPAPVRQGVRPLRGGPGGGSRRAGRLPRHRRRGRPGGEAVDLAPCRGADRRSRAVPPLHDRLRQFPAAGGASVQPAERDRLRAGDGHRVRGGAGIGRPPARGPLPRRDHGPVRGRERGAARPRPCAPRLGVQGAALTGRGGPQGGKAARRGRHLQSGTRDRHGGGRPGDPGRVAAVRGLGAAAGGTRRAPGRRRVDRGGLPQVPR